MLIGVIAEELLLPNVIVEIISAHDDSDAFLPGLPGGLLSEAANAADIINTVFICNAVISEAAAADSTLSITGAITGTIDEVGTADSLLDTTVTSAPARSAMLPGVFVNSDTSREANVAGIMVNIL